MTVLDLGALLDRRGAMNLADIKRLSARGQSEQIEFKKSTAQLKRAAETLCGFLNAKGGQVLLGVTREGKVVGQEVADSTLQNIAAGPSKFEPAAPISIKRVALKTRGEVVVLCAAMAFDEVVLPVTSAGLQGAGLGHLRGSLGFLDELGEEGVVAALSAAIAERCHLPLPRSMRACTPSASWWTTARP